DGADDDVVGGAPCRRAQRARQERRAVGRPVDHRRAGRQDARIRRRLRGDLRADASRVAAGNRDAGCHRPGFLVTVRLKADTTHVVTVRLKADTTYVVTVRLKADTTYVVTVRLKADTTYVVTVRLKAYPTVGYVVSGFSRTVTVLKADPPYVRSESRTTRSCRSRSRPIRSRMDCRSRLRCRSRRAGHPWRSAARSAGST